MFDFLLYGIPSLFIMLAFHFFLRQKYTYKELAMQAVVTLIIIGSVIMIDSFAQTTDYKFINGVVVSKEDIKRNCRSTWAESKDSWCDHHDSRTSSRLKTRTVSVSDGKGGTTSRVETYTEYYTEYRPIFPWERKFFVKSTIGTYRIDREDRQGVVFPARYNIVKNGDPVTDLSSYNNYVKAAASSLFKYEDDSYPDLVIKRPGIYDYYKVNRVIIDEGVVLPKGETWESLNEQIAVINSSFKNGANLLLYITDKGDDFGKSLQVKWQGFKINDVIVVLGLDKSGEMYNYVSVYSWSESSMVEVEVKDIFAINPSADAISKELVEVAASVSRTFVEPNPEKFVYLKTQIELSTFSVVLLILISLVVTPLVSLFFAKEDIL